MATNELYRLNKLRAIKRLPFDYFVVVTTTIMNSDSPPGPYKPPLFYDCEQAEWVGLEHLSVALGRSFDRFAYQPFDEQLTLTRRFPMMAKCMKGYSASPPTYQNLSACWRELGAHEIVCGMDLIPTFSYPNKPCWTLAGKCNAAGTTAGHFPFPVLRKTGLGEFDPNKFDLLDANCANFNLLKSDLICSNSGRWKAVGDSSLDSHNLLNLLCWNEAVCAIRQRLDLTDEANTHYGVW